MKGVLTRERGLCRAGQVAVPPKEDGRRPGVLVQVCREGAVEADAKHHATMSGLFKGPCWRGLLGGEAAVGDERMAHHERGLLGGQE